jgi:DNA-binding Lrp family transcriptional regulator
MQNSDAVHECHNITGAIKYLVRVEVADITAYKEFHAEVLGALPQVNFSIPSSSVYYLIPL